MRNEIIIYSIKLANKIVNAGFKVLRTDINFKNPNYKVFVFENRPEIQAMLDSFVLSKKGG